MNIQKVSIEAVSIKKTNKEGKPYTYAEKNKQTKVPTGKQIPRTMVSIKVGEEWFMGWSYKDGSAAESLKKGDVVELMFTEDNGFKNWKFPKPEDITAAENEELKRKLAAFEAAQGSGISNVPYTGPSALSAPAVQSTSLAQSNPAAQEEPPF